MSDSNLNLNLIECGDHQFAPWSIVCKHLMSGESREWIPFESDNPEVDYDWVCPKCEETMDNPNIEDLGAVCIHCVRVLREKYDPNFVNENETSD